MGHNDHFDDDEPDLPPEAGNADFGPFDPNDDWIRTAPRELQIEAMRRWFCERYEDPANNTPYESAEGGYQFIWGGPYDPDDEIQERFGEVVEYDVMEELIEDLHQNVGDRWAPIEHDYDEALSMLVVNRSDPHRMLSDRLSQIIAVLTVTGHSQAIELTTQLAHGAAITALESYLWDTVAYWAANDERTFRTLVATNKDFQAKTLQLSAIFERFDGLRDELETYLQDFVWHRLDKAKPMIEQGLQIKVPDIGNLMREVLVRHDIVHRGGRTKDGEPVSVSAEDVHGVVESVRAFVDAIEAQLDQRYPTKRSDKF